LRAGGRRPDSEARKAVPEKRGRPGQGRRLCQAKNSEGVDQSVEATQNYTVG
jgi:hypothetical protein